MRCPACRGAMVVAEYEKVEVDYCSKCSGIWFDAAEVELLPQCVVGCDGGENLAAIMAQPEVSGGGKPRPCLACGRKMREVGIGQPPVLVDLCPAGHGLWFDGGELHSIVAQGQAGAGSGLFAFLAGLFKAETAGPTEGKSG